MANTVLFQDNFNKPLKSAQWHPNVGEGSFYGRTQQRDSLPKVSDGVLHLRLDTYNPSNGNNPPSFLGSEAITNQAFGFDHGDGVAFVIRARYVAPFQGGIVGGMFPYANTGGNRHDEIDFEALSNNLVGGLNQIQTNVYANEPLGAGHPVFEPISSSLSDWHTYRIVWRPNEVRWVVDGELVRVDKDHVPQHPMQLHLNIWAPGAEWAEAYSPLLQPTTNPQNNLSYFFEVDWVKVLRLDDSPANTVGGTNGVNALRGTNGADLIKAKAGDDSAAGRAGDDVILGGNGDDRLTGGSGDDDLRGQSGDDLLKGGKGDDLLNGGAHDDDLRGQSGDDLLKGGSGDDNLDGGNGDDTLRGQAGADTLRGGRGDDDLNGGAGDDLLDGGRGNDRLAGREGDNTFAFTTPLGPDNVDTIVDLGPNDWIKLDRSVFPGIGPKGMLADEMFTTSVVDTGVHPFEPDARIVYNPQSGALFFDENGNAPGGLVQFAQLAPGTPLDHTGILVG